MSKAKSRLIIDYEAASFILKMAALYYCPILVNNIATESGLARNDEWLVFN